MRKFLCFLVFVFIFSPEISISATSEHTTEEKHMRFKLFAECKPMDILVEHLSSSASKLGLTRKSLQHTAESRLRSARLYNSKASHYLYVNLFAKNGVFSLELAFKKIVQEPMSGVNAFATTWVVQSIGSYGDSGASFIFSTLSKYTDEFLTEFLRVNEKACVKRWK